MARDFGRELNVRNIRRNLDRNDVIWVFSRRANAVIPVSANALANLIFNESSLGSTSFDDITIINSLSVGGDSTFSGFTLGADISELITEVGHGFSVGEAVYFSDPDYELAQSNSITTIGTGIVSKVVSSDAFYVTFMGKVGGLSGLTPNSWYYVSESTPGVLTTSSGSTYINPIGRAVSSTELFVFPMRADQVQPTVDGLTTQSAYDSVNTQYFYTGRAVMGSATSSAVWKISRYDLSDGSVVTADGDLLYDNIYDNRESLSYS